MRKMTQRSLLCCMATCIVISGLFFVGTGIITVLREESLEPSTCSTPWSSPCFDRSRCLGPDGSQNLSIYALDLNCTRAPSADIMERKKPVLDKHYPNAILKAFRTLALERGLLAENIEDACIIVYAIITENKNCVRNTPEWDMGRNHILFDVGDHTR